MSLSTLEEQICIVLKDKQLSDQQILRALRHAGTGCESGLLHTALHRMERKGLILAQTAHRANQIAVYYQLAPLGQRVIDRLQEIRLLLSRWHPSDS